nr:immunoglobulin light chain junction region [Macaca mulatta]
DYYFQVWDSSRKYVLF